jgi:uncharacterized membrane protein
LTAALVDVLERRIDVTELIAMQALSTIPNWAELHPLVIHFPIALLLVAPLFIIFGIIVNPQQGRPFLLTALSLIALGTLGTVLAVATGEAAADVAHRTATMSAVLERHQELAENTQDIFALLTVIFAAILFLPRLLKREITTAVARILPLAFLVFYGAGAVVLVNTAHNGGRLVHEYGIHAMLAPTNQANNDAIPEATTDKQAEEKR